MTSGQSVRPSQFILNYGIGALLETAEGPGVMADWTKSGLFNDPVTGATGVVPDIAHFEITDQRLSAALLGGARIFALPTNDDLNLGATRGIFRTFPFPEWSFCVSAGHPAWSVIYRLIDDNSKSRLTGCPDCGELPRFEARRKARAEAMTFVRACPAGHLDDVHWPAVVPHAKNGCDGQVFRWQGVGGSLANIRVECTDCAGSTDMRSIYTNQWPCSGRWPEKGRARGSCSQRTRVLLKGAANLRIPEIVSALTIPPNDSQYHRILSRAPFKVALKLNPVKKKADLLHILDRLKEDLRPDEVAVLREASEGEILGALADLARETGPMDAHQMKVEEFEKLKAAAKSGAPAVRAKKPSMPDTFEVIKRDIRDDLRRPGGHMLRVAPVNRLRVVMAQVGYTRLVSDTVPDFVPTPYDDGVNRWYPGVELSGEGVFVDFLDGTPEPKGKHATAWMTQYRAQTDPKLVRATDHPVFVWWHTYAHRLISAISVDSGYSAAAIRERVYVNIDPKTGKADGGVLLYTSQPGGDGTLGGMIALVPRFDAILGDAEAFVDSCSNDPICEEEEYSQGKPNGAACYACQMVSETSCEHRNMSLDRNLLRDNMP